MQFLMTAGPQQWQEEDWFVACLRETVEAWKDCVDQAAVLVLRHVVWASALDDEIKESLQRAPDWLGK
jgi:hypothetical protein